MNSVKDIWQKVLDILAQQLTPTAMETWFFDCVPVELDDCRLVLTTTSEFKQEIIQKRFSDRIKAALFDLFATDFEVLVLTEEDLLNDPPQRDGPNSLPEMAGYTFDHFIVGNSNRFARAAAVAVSARAKACSLKGAVTFRPRISPARPAATKASNPAASAGAKGT